ncbi:MAG: hypothetical protein ACPGQL_07440 [Thermoplasmatota archaeon]
MTEAPSNDLAETARPAPGVSVADDRPVALSWQATGRFLLLVGGIFLLEFALLTGAAVVVNPYSQFPTDTFEPLVPNQFRAKVELYEALDEPAQTVVFGSSRGQKVLPTVLEENGFGRSFNFAVGGAEIVDERAIYDYIVAEHGAPENIVIALDMYQLRRGISPSLILQGVPQLAAQTEAQVDAFDYAEMAAYQALRWQHLEDLGTVFWFTATGYPEGKIKFLEDGSPRLLQFRHEAGEELGGLSEDVILASFAHHRPSYLGFEQVSASEAARLDAWIGDAIADGVNVHVFLTPIYPEFLEWAKSDTRLGALHPQIRGALEGACRDGLHVYDFVDVTSFDGDPDDFNDAVHGGGGNLQRIVEELASGERDLCAAST